MVQSEGHVNQEFRRYELETMTISEHNSHCSQVWENLEDPTGQMNRDNCKRHPEEEANSKEIGKEEKLFENTSKIFFEGPQKNRVDIYNEHSNLL